MERRFARLGPLRRLGIRHERRAELHLALTTLACAVICLRQITVSSRLSELGKFPKGPCLEESLWQAGRSQALLH